MPNRITSWSNSRLGTYSQCPLKAKLTIIDKLKEPKSAAMARGSDIHKIAECYIKGKPSCVVGGEEVRGQTVGGTKRSLRSFPPELAKHEALVKRLRAKYKKDPASMVVEDMWVFRKDWSGTTWNDWNGAWARIKLDVAERDGDDVHIIDFKTGRYYAEKHAEYMDQLELYGLGALLVFAGVGASLRVLPHLVYLDAGLTFPTEPVVYAPEDVPRLKKAWEKRVKPMLSDKTFAPRANKYCYSCAFRKDAGGPCKY